MRVIRPVLLRLVRESSGRSQEDFAALFGLRQAIWSKYENGNAQPTAETLSHLCARTGYEPAFFSAPVPEMPVGLVFHRKRAALPAAVRAAGVE